MNLMVILPRVPYPIEKGDKLRAYHQIKELSKQHDITLCALNDKPLHPKALENLKPFCKSIHIFNLTKPGILWNIIKAGLTGKPFQVGYYFNRKILKKIDHIILQSQPDHIYCQLIRVAEYVKNTDIPKTLDYQDVFSKGIERRIKTAPLLFKPVFTLEFKRLKKYEHQAYNLFNHTTIISIPDRQHIPHSEREQIAIIPNGVDFDFFSPRNHTPEYELAFTGNMAYAPNVDAAEYLAKEILPRIHKTHPHVRLILAGATPSAKVKALANKHITISGWMDDIRDGYSAAKIFIAPMRIGTGLQNKLLEAMAMKMPCITTPLANGALEARPEFDILLGSDADTLAAQVIRLLDSEALFATISTNGHQFVKRTYSWIESTNKLNNIMCSATK